MSSQRSQGLTLAQQEMVHGRHGRARTGRCSGGGGDPPVEPALGRLRPSFDLRDEAPISAARPCCPCRPWTI